MSNLASRLSAVHTRKTLRSGFQLGKVFISPRTGTITGPGGTFQLDPKVMSVLVCLAQSAGELVPRETLMQEVWDKVIVTDFALSRCIYQLRKQLTRAAQVDESPIETLPKRGYRLTWPLSITGSAAIVNTVKPRRTRTIGISLILALLIIVTATLVYQLQSPSGVRSSTESGALLTHLAVFPLEDLSDDHDQGVFARGFSQELIHELARMPAIVVKGRNSLFNQDLVNDQELVLANGLGVEYVVGGSIRPIGNSRRILLYLKTVPDGEQLWSHSVLLEPNPPFKVLRVVAENVARLLQFSVNPTQTIPSTESLEAFELFLSAYETPNFEAQRTLLQRAVELDPSFARAWTALASIEVIRVWNGEETIENAWARCQPYLERAMEIDPQSPWVYVEMGRFKREFGDMEEAIRLFRKALELDPGDVWASANLGLVLRFTGRFEEALAVHERDMLLDPLDANAQTRLGTSHWFMGNYEEAERRYQLAVELDPLNEEAYDSWAGMLGAGLGKFNEALLMLQRKMKIENPPTFRSLSTTASLASILNLKNLAGAYWHRAQQLEPNSIAITVQKAVYYLGRNEDANAELAAQHALSEVPNDISAQLVMTILDSENSRTDEMFERLNHAFSGLQGSDQGVVKSNIEEALLMAYAMNVKGQAESAKALLQSVVELLIPPRAREHFLLAAAYAMQGEADLAMAELRASPPGRVRLHATTLMRDPRFTTLHELPDFQDLVRAHLDELEGQRIAFLSASGSSDSQLASKLENDSL